MPLISRWILKTYLYGNIKIYTLDDIWESKCFFSWTRPNKLLDFEYVTDDLKCTNGSLSASTITTTSTLWYSTSTYAVQMMFWIAIASFLENELYQLVEKRGAMRHQKKAKWQHSKFLFLWKRCLICSLGDPIHTYLSHWLFGRHYYQAASENVILFQMCPYIWIINTTFVAAAEGRE